MPQVYARSLAPLMPNRARITARSSDYLRKYLWPCIELMAGRAAERMLMGDDEPRSRATLSGRLREPALLICTSEQAIETFIARCDVAARDLLMPYGYVVIALSIVLRIKRTLDGAEIDKSSQTCRPAWRLPLNVRAATIGATVSWRLSALKRNSSRRCASRATFCTRSGAVIVTLRIGWFGGCTRA